MRFIPQAIPDIFVIEIESYHDKRGYFAETYREEFFNEALGYRLNFVQENESKSLKGVLRGLHFQIPPYSQSKLVKVIDGAVLDIAVDIRKNSPSFGQHVAVELSSDNKKQMLIPRGFAHGFLVLTDTATFSYKVDNYYSPNFERGLVYNDIELNINWPIAKMQLLISEKDIKLPKIRELKNYFIYGSNYYE